MATVETAARLHFGFQNLSLAHERLYGGIGVALAEPRLVVEAERDDGINCQDDRVAPYADRVVAELGVPGARVSFREGFDRHVGLGSGTQLALATLAGVAAAHNRAPAVRERAPAMGRGGRSGVGVAAFEAGGFVVDAGHPTERFTTDPPDPGEWTVPAVAVRHDLPSSWRFLLVVPDADSGRSGDDETESMRAVVENADPSVADELSTLLLRRLLPAAAEGRLEGFGDAVGAFGRLNGAWYADEQGGVYRPPAGRVIDALADRSAIRGVGQSSWGPIVYGVTDAARADRARTAAEDALGTAGVSGTVRTVRPRNEGARVRPAAGASTI